MSHLLDVVLGDLARDEDDAVADDGLAHAGALIEAGDGHGRSIPFAGFREELTWRAVQ